MTAVPAGWYPDPSGQFETRYWDGTAWTHHTARPVNSTAAEAASSAPNQRIDHASAAAPRNTATAHRDARSAPGDRGAASHRPRRRRPAATMVVSDSDRSADRETSSVAARAVQQGHIDANDAARIARAATRPRQARITHLDRDALRDAIVLNEVLGPPVALRPPER